jgi:phosphoglycolate phosphatase
MPPVKNIIFDWSGTLADDFSAVLKATNEVFAEYQKPAWTEEEFREKFYLPFPDFYAEYLPEASMIQLDHHYHTSFKLLQEKIPLLPGARAILDWCREEGIRTFLLSTIHAEHFDIQAERLNVKSYFTQAYVQAVDKRKVILQLLAEHDLNPSETLFVGDMQHDIETARHGGVRSCAVLTGYDSLSKLTSVSPDLIFKNLGGLLDHLRLTRTEPDTPPIPTVGALILNPDGQMLMIRTFKWNDCWGIPGGKIQAGESSLDALEREVREETGLQLEKTRFVMVQDCIHSEEFFKPAHFILLNYIAHTPMTEVTLNEEADEYRWVTLPEARSLKLNTPTRILIDACEREGIFQ